MPKIGEVLAERYRLDAPIGSGGYAAVFRAHDLRLERDVAVKVLVANDATDPAVAARFDREARVLAAISHPNVVAIHDHAPGDPSTGAEPFLVMDLCEGGSLAERLAAAESGTLQPDELIPILIDVTAGLEALHSRGIVHRDLKPSNILLSEGRAQIADLGIAAIGPSELTVTGTTVGTLAYLAPEQLAGEPATPASDVHALGTIAFLGLTGRLPRPAENYAAIVAASGKPVEPISAVQPGLGQAFDAPIAQALAVNPLSRPTAQELGASLGDAVERWRMTPASLAASEAVTVVAPLVPASKPPVVPESTPPVVPESKPATVEVADARRTSGRLLQAVAMAVFVVFLGLAAFALLQSPNAGGSPSPSPSLTGSASPSPTTAATASPPPTADPFADARAASDDMGAAIAGARGGNGLSGREARELEGLLDRFDHALDEQDVSTAREQANELAQQVADLVEQGDVEGQAAERLSSAANALVATANALQD